MKTNYVYTVDLSVVPAEYWQYYKNMGITDKSTVVCLGEIGNMPGHFIVATTEGKVVFGLHDDMFIEVVD